MPRIDVFVLTPDERDNKNPARLKLIKRCVVDSIPRINETVVLEEGSTGFRVDNVVHRIGQGNVEIYLGYYDTMNRFPEIKGESK